LTLYNKSSVVAQMGDRARAKWAENCCAGCAPFHGGGSYVLNVAWAEVYLRTKWHLDPSSRLATIDMGRKVGCCCTPFRGAARSPSNTMSPGPRPTSAPSGILIHSTVCPQYTDKTYIQDRQTGQRSNSIRRTVLQMVTPKGYAASC